MLAWMFAVSSNAQDASSPPPEMQKLNVLEGTWDATIKAGPADSKGVAIYKIDLGGMWLTMTGPGSDGKEEGNE